MPRYTPEPYAPRPITPGEVLCHAGYRLKTYTITLPGEIVDWSSVGDGMERILAVLPHPAVSAQRPGLGFLIRHQGVTADYLVLTWYDRTNEMLQRIWFRDCEYGGDGGHGAGEWRDGAGIASFCVWDQQVIHHEREAFVRTMLTESPDAEAYLGDSLRA